MNLPLYFIFSHKYEGINELFLSTLYTFKSVNKWFHYVVKKPKHLASNARLKVKQKNRQLRNKSETNIEKLNKLVKHNDCPLRRNKAAIGSQSEFRAHIPIKQMCLILGTLKSEQILYLQE